MHSDGGARTLNADFEFPGGNRYALAALKPELWIT
jgi:hypothetical protein